MSVKRYDFDGYVFNVQECDDGDYVLYSDYAALLARHNALKEAVAWEREFDEVLVWLVQTGRYPKAAADREVLFAEDACARAAVDALVGEG